MFARLRTIGAAPRRTTGETWAAVRTLLIETLGRSKSLDRGVIEAELEAIGHVARMLIAAGHLEREPLVLVAGTLHLSVKTVSGTPSLAAEENLNPVPGTSSAKTWRAYLPAPPPLTASVQDAVRGLAHVVAGTAPTAAELTLTDEADSDVIDLAAFRDLSTKEEA